MNWGIVGYGEIAPSFICGLKSVNGARLSGIASKSKYKILRENDEYKDVKIYENYNELYRDNEIDIVYICLVNNLHKKNVFDALNAGKHVLCEKPMAMNTQDSIEMIALAREKKLFLMEGMWTRFLPAYRKFKEIISSKEIGLITLLKVDFGFLSKWDKERRLLNRNLFGGNLLDNADYNLFLCNDLFDLQPEKVFGCATFADTGVENSCSLLFQYSNGAMAQLYSSFILQTKQDAIIYGTEGYIILEEFWHGTKIEIVKNNRKKKLTFPFKQNGFEYEIEEVEKCIERKEIESNIVSHETSIEISKLMDNIFDILKIV